MDLSPGTRLGPDDIAAKIGAGGMGEVYRAHDTRLHRDVALKILPPELTSDPARHARFVQEARAASALAHPHIAVVHDIGEADGVTFIAMELVRGEPLSDRIARGAAPPERAVDLAIEIAEALAHAHDVGLVHRDLKPANVMVTTEGHAKIIDFGLAKLIDVLGGESRETVTRQVTESGMVLGTVSYTSPEQAEGAPVDHRSDIFSFGIVLYEMLAGRRPFAGRTTIDTLDAQHLGGPPASASLGVCRRRGRARSNCDHRGRAANIAHIAGPSDRMGADNRLRRLGHLSRALGRRPHADLLAGPTHGQ